MILFANLNELNAHLNSELTLELILSSLKTETPAYLE
jgi:hypothetical protein